MVDRPVSAQVLLALTGAVSVLLYESLDGSVLGLALAEPTLAWQVFPWSDVWARPPAAAGDLTEITLAGTRFSLTLGALFVAYLVGLRLLGHLAGVRGAVIVFGFAVAFQMQQLDAPAMLSSDPYSYLMYGRIAALHGGDPYLNLPAAYPDDPVLPYIYWTETPSFYGPLWTIVSAGLAMAGGDTVGLAILLLRGIAAIAALGAGALIWISARRSGTVSPALAAAIWLWNPLVPLETGLSGHNDSVLVALLLGTVVATQYRWFVMVGLLGAAGILVKAAGLLVLPLAGVALARGPRSSQQLSTAIRVAGGAVIVIGGLLVLGRSPLEGSGVGALGVDTSRYTNSIHEPLLGGMRFALGDSFDDIRTPLDFVPRLGLTRESTDLWTSSWGPRRLIGLLPAQETVWILAPAERGWWRVLGTDDGRVGYVRAAVISAAPPGAAVDAEHQAALVSWLRSLRLDEANRWLRAATLAAFAAALIGLIVGVWRGASPLTATAALLLTFLVITATWIWPWYVLWPLGFVALRPVGLAAPLALTLSASSLLVYPLFGYQGSELWWLFNLRSLAVWLIPTVAVIILHRRTRRKSYGDLTPAADGTGTALSR